MGWWRKQNAPRRAELIFFKIDFNAGRCKVLCVREGGVITSAPRLKKESSACASLSGTRTCNQDHAKVTCAHAYAHGASSLVEARTRHVRLPREH